MTFFVLFMPRIVDFFIILLNFTKYILDFLLQKNKKTFWIVIYSDNIDGDRLSLEMFRVERKPV